MFVQSEVRRVELAEEVAIPLREGSEISAGFGDLFDTQFPRLAAYCAGLVDDAELGADLAQEALARTWGRWATVREPRAYAYLVATNLVRDTWQTRSRRHRAMMLLAADRDGEVPPPDGSLRDLVERLPERLRVPTLLHYYADLPAEEVARLLRRPAGTIRQRLHEARRRLATSLGEG